MHEAIHGRVIDMGRKPVTDASIAVVAGPSPAPDIAAMSDEQGCFTLGGLTAGWWRVRAYAPDGTFGETFVELPQHKPAEIMIEELATRESR